MFLQLLLIMPITQELPTELLKRCSSQRALSAVEALCELGPRSGGTPSGHASAAWIARRLRGMNLSPTVLEDPPIWAYESKISTLRATATHEDGRTTNLELTSAIAFQHSSASEGSANLSVELPTTGAFLGPRVPRTTETGALSPAIILVDSGEATPRPRSLRPGGAKPSPTLSIGAHEGEWLRSAMASGAEVRLEWSTEASSYRASPRSVFAAIPARQGALPGFFLITAHAESVGGGEGLNGNASGVSVLLEVARAWGSAVRDGAVPGPAREVRFAIWGARGHSARAWMTRHQGAAGERLLGVLNLEQLARSSAGRRLHFEPDDHPSNKGMIEHIWEELSSARGRLGTPERWASNRNRGSADLGPFLRLGSGRSNAPPSLTLFAAGGSEPEVVDRSLGLGGTSWRHSDKIQIPHDPLLRGKLDGRAAPPEDSGALLEVAARTVLLILPSWLERLSQEE